MDDNFTVESMLKEVKGNLNKYENLLKIGESSPTEKTIKGIDSIKKTIENNLKLVKSVVTKEEDKFQMKEVDNAFNFPMKN